MLDGLRDFAKTWPGKILGIFMLIGLAGFGITGVLTGTSFNTVAKVSGEKITSVQFQRIYNAQLNNMSQQIGSVPTAEQAISLGIPSNVINQLAGEASINALGKEFGLGVSDERLGEMVRQDPSFGNTLGVFEPENFRAVLQRSGWTEKEYFDMQKKAAARAQLTNGLFGGLSAPKAAYELVSRYDSDKRDIEYFIVSGQNMLPPAEPTRAEIAQYLSDNQSAFRTQTLRNVKVITLTPAIIAKSLTASEQDIIDEYERTKANYIRIETRNIKQVNLSSEIILKRFELGQETGENFLDLVAETGSVISDLGAMTKAQILDSNLAETAFSLNEGEFRIIDGFDGKRAVFVEKITPGGQMSLEELREQISDRVKNKQARELYVDMLDNIEEQRAAFKPFDEIARQFDLEVIMTAVAENGDGLESITNLPSESYGRVSSAIFAAKEDGLTPSVALGSNMNLWFELVSIETARNQTIDEVGDEIKKLLLEQRINAALANQVNDIVQSINNGEDFATIAVSNQFTLAQSNGITRTSTSDVLSQSVIEAIFNGGNGHTGSALNNNGDYVVFHVLDVSTSNQNNEAVNEFVKNSIIDSTFGEFITGLVEDGNLRINQETLSQILNPPTYGGGN